MPQPLRIAISIDLDWPLKRHHEVYSGIQDYSKWQAPHWELVRDLFPAKWVQASDDLPGYDAIIGRISKADFQAAERAEVPVVNVWINSPVRDASPSVLADHAEAGRMAAEHLLSRGLGELGFIGFRHDTVTKTHFDSMAAIAKERGVAVTRHTTYNNHTQDEKRWHRFVRGVNQWIDGWRLPIGIISSYDELARSLMTMCQRRGLKIPEDVAVVGASDEPIQCEASDPELTSIDMGHYRVGYAAAELLDQLLSGAAPPAEPIISPPADLVARQSTDVYAVADQTVGRAMRYIAEHCNEPIRVADVASHVGCHRRKLEKQFRAAGRGTINEEIVALRIELAKRLLVATDDAIQQVAMNAGYGTAQHMRHVFRHQVGASPTDYRQEQRK